MFYILLMSATAIQGQTFSSRDADWYSALFDVGGVVGQLGVLSC